MQRTKKCTCIAATYFQYQDLRYTGSSDDDDYEHVHINWPVSYSGNKCSFTYQRSISCQKNGDSCNENQEQRLVSFTLNDEDTVALNTATTDACAVDEDDTSFNGTAGTGFSALLKIGNTVNICFDKCTAYLEKPDGYRLLSSSDDDNQNGFWCMLKNQEKVSGNGYVSNTKKSDKLSG